MAQAGAVVDIVGAKYTTDKLLQYKIIFVCGLRGGETGQRITAILLLYIGQVFGDIVNSLLPRTRLELSVFTDEWSGQAFFAVNKIETKTAFNTQHTLVND